MDKKLQDHVWSILPKEFKEEVKRLYDNSPALGAKAVLLLENLFGIPNLTSDAEGEEMLTCEKSKVKDLLQWCNESSEENEETSIVKNILSVLFGSKCLPDEEQPKQKDCDNPLADKEGCRWRNDGKCAFDSACYFEPLNPQETTDHIPDVTKMVDNIIKEGFLKERRCNIAVQMVKAITQSPEIVDRISSAATDSLLDDILSDALYLTDKLIEKCEKGGSK